MISAFDLFKVGIGPSSSHTVGPMRAAHLFVSRLRRRRPPRPAPPAFAAELFGSLGVTGHGHGSVKAVVLGLEGEQPRPGRPGRAPSHGWTRSAPRSRLLRPAERTPIAFSMDDDLVLHRRKRLPFHTNGMLFSRVGRGRQRCCGAGSTTPSAAGSSSTRTRRAARPSVEDATPVTYPFQHR